ncbi:vacuolar ATP synthase subunit H [Pelomyxa schiedti]|nr:vacuolar ATP synthase subunit H [Pelomyxa schiedti]
MSTTKATATTSGSGSSPTLRNASLDMPRTSPTLRSPSPVGEVVVLPGPPGSSATTPPPSTGLLTPGDPSASLKAAVDAAEQLQSWLKEPITREEVAGRTIAWDGHVHAELLTSQQAEMLKAYDKRELSAKTQMIASRGVEYVHLLLHLLTTINTVDTQQYIILLLAEIVEVDPDRRLPLILQVEAHMDPYVPLLNLSCKEGSDWFCQKEAFMLLARLFCKAQNINPEHIERFLDQLCKQLVLENPVEVRIAVLPLMKLLVRPDFRIPFYQRKGVQLLTDVIACHLSVVKFQLLYEVIFCIWLLCYEKDIASHLPDELIPHLVDIIKLVQKEKVHRVCIATFRNMSALERNLVGMISCGVHRMMPLLLSRKWGDTDVADDLQEIDSAIQKQLHVMSSFDVYKHEILSRRLEWSPVHQSDKFWRENASRFEENKYEMLGTLEDILKTSEDPVVLSVACHDLGEFVQHHPRGRSLINQMNVKVELMKLLQHKSPEVQKHALFSLQKMMAHKWDNLGS